MAESRLTAVVETKGATRANSELNKLSKTSKKVEGNVINAEKRFKSFGKNAAASIAAVDGPLGGVSSRVSSLVTVLTSGTAAMTLFAGAIVGAGVVIVQGISALDEFEVNLKRVNATINATGAGVGFTGEALRNEAEAIALATLTSVDAVQKAQAKLLTFNRVLGDEFSRSIRLSQDLAEAGFGSIESNAILLGKALQDPIKGMSALSRVGVTLSETQKQLAEDAVNVGDVFTAQQIILDAVAGQVEGVAAAVADGTLAGAIDTLGQNWDELTRNVARNTGALTTWTQIVNGAAVTAKIIADALAGPTSDELFTAALASSIALSSAEEKLQKILDDKTLGYQRQKVLVDELRVANEEAVKAASAAAEKENAQIIAKGNAQKKEIDARKVIAAEVKAEADAKDAKEKAIEDAKLQRKKDSAQKELETILNLNDSELQAIQTLEDARIEKAAASYAQQLISFQEFLSAKSAIELNADESRKAIADKNDADAQVRTDKLLGQISSVSDSFVDAAINGEDLGAVVVSTVKGIASAVIKSGIDILVKQLITDKVATAAFVGTKTAEVAATTAQAGLNAFAATAAIPVVGPALAPAAATAAIGFAGALGAPVIAAAAARAQGGSLNAGQSSTIVEKGELEILTPASSSRIRTKQQMKSLMGEGGSNSAPVVNVVNINQSNGPLDIETTTDDDGRIINLIRSTVSLDAQNANSDIRKSFGSSTTLEARR